MTGEENEAQDRKRKAEESSGEMPCESKKKKKEAEKKMEVPDDETKPEKKRGRRPGLVEEKKGQKPKKARTGESKEKAAGSCETEPSHDANEKDDEGRGKGCPKADKTTKAEDIEKKKKLSRKSAAYHRAKYAALAAGEDKEQASKKGREAACHISGTNITYLA